MFSQVAFLVVSVAALGAFACPDLSGTFSCQDNFGQSWAHVSNQFVNSDGYTVYGNGDNNNVVIADGVARTQADGQGGYQVYKGYCQDPNFIVEAEIHLADGTIQKMSSKNFKNSNGQYISEIFLEGALIQTGTCSPQ